MKYYAVIDTNVLIGALLSKKPDTATVKILKAVMDGSIIPLLHEEILEEYAEVLNRPKFHLSFEVVQTVLKAIKDYGLIISPMPTNTKLIDPDDLIFYETAREKQDINAYLITGNVKHYPECDFIVTPANMIEIMLFLSQEPGT